MVEPSTSGAGSIVAPGSSTVTLTDREHEVAALLACGLSHKRVANRLGLSTATVGVHVHNIAARIPGNGNPTVKVVVWWMNRHAL